ncbi:outer membrane protein [Rhizobium etli 8C-3]|uniref:Outer membrane beta-barrel protein n=2 Tax=Rhizobium TaxID=379 RepID=A0A4R3RIR1_9HYPH|nr:MULTISPECIES: outer membrane beta-barrel protein [Rhizobium]APO76242.1 outer membrane protein [Rhizobium etli 8C-3]TCU22364.1 hypothetical protein EV130_109158 [Rhizobium azibense]TCU35583.1 hypothetical protein EV129_109176 [Rhizobium azibense]
MVKERETSSLTPLRAARFAVSSLALCALFLPPHPGFAQSAQNSTSSSTPGYSSASGSQSYGGSANAQQLPENGAVDGSDLANPPAYQTSGTPPGSNQQAGTTMAAGATEQEPSSETTGSILDEDIRRLNTREPAIDDRRAPRRLEENLTGQETPGIRVGTFVLRPSVNQSINTETTKEGETKETRSFAQTDAYATLTSDWALHQLIVTSQGTWQRNVSGTGEEQPAFDIDGDLRLDLPDDTVAHIKGGYRFYREDTDDPDAIADAEQQSDVQEFSAGASLERDFGILRATAALDLTRTIYSDAVLSNGTRISLSDRDRTSGTFLARVGYELSPALIPFLEASVGKTVYDESRDSAGFARSGNSYGAKAGVEVDLGEKLKGEVGLGYETASFDDSRLDSIDTAIVDANLLWSPLRGTDVRFDLSTSIQPSTTAGQSGYVSHELTTALTHQLRDNLQATVLGGVILRDYPSGGSSDETVYTASGGLTLNINRYLDFTSTLGYELTTRDVGADSQQWRAGVGLKLKR